jgi:Flp pilus assembly protein TadG
LRRRADDGNAIVEFVWLAVLLLVPLLYVVLAAVTVQRTAFGLTTAAREAGRAYATAGSDAAGERRAEMAAQLAMRDQGVAWAPDGRVVSCGECTYAVGSVFDVDLRVRVRLPFIPLWMCGQRCVAGITVSAHHRERLDCYSGIGTVTGSPC